MGQVILIARLSRLPVKKELDECAYPKICITSLSRLLLWHYPKAPTGLMARQTQQKELELSKQWKPKFPFYPSSAELRHASWVV